MTEKGDITYPAGGGVAILEGGAVVPIGPRQLSPAEIIGQLKDAAALPYMGTDPAKIGMTLIEAAAFELWRKASEGDVDAFVKGLDRLMGKPVQQVLSATGSLKEFLDAIARSESAAPTDIDPLSE
jgi:hypothetical protein